ncbi:MAG: hypothetical protein KJ759_09690, partial [Alphaproteobacteria bacterium]|nr:hypothetical protein [Alphaproteobacteria bacterium]MBU4545973.1 hypothetical protein [Alphaproteobacteria bacterium]MBU4548798.1 hypothetical protein [Alphaproteobacteria bacterium]
YGKRYRSGLRVATTLAESAVNSLVSKRMVKKQQMRWSRHGAHMLMQGASIGSLIIQWDHNPLESLNNFQFELFLLH